MSTRWTLDQWLVHIARIHPASMALGLDRVGEVYRRLGGGKPAAKVITIAGTNGKGSSGAFLSAIARASGLRVGTFSSPHLFRFNERISVNLSPVSDRQLVTALATVEKARKEIPLTYFEYALLAATVAFRFSRLDLAVLEVGLGGRLDAVNVVDPDVALITNIGFDHMRWLGDTLDLIAVEKAGILRPGQVAICAQSDAPRGLHQRAAEVGVDWRVAGRDFAFDGPDFGSKASAGHRPPTWSWRGVTSRLDGLPLPTLAGDHQLVNASGSLAALEGAGLLPDVATVSQGVSQARIAGRLWQVASRPAVVLDVGHNPAAGRVIRQWLEREPCEGQTWVVLGMLRDKNPQDVVAALNGAVDHYIFCGLPGGRGQTPRQLRSRVRRPGLRVRLAADPVAGYQLALAGMTPQDRLLVIGSFLTVEQVARHLTLNETAGT